MDIVLGPALTLVVFKTGKPGLKKDLSIIAAIQIFGFIYGAHAFYIERPAFAIFYDSDYFEVIPASEMEDLGKLDPALGHSKLGGPSIVFVEAPTEISELQKILEEMIKGAPPIHLRPEFYKPLKENFNKKFRLSRDLDKLQAIPENETAIAQFKSEYGERVNEFVYFPIRGKVTSRLLVIDRKTEMVVDTIGINPGLKLPG